MIGCRNVLIKVACYRMGLLRFPLLCSGSSQNRVFTYTLGQNSNACESRHKGHNWIPVKNKRRGLWDGRIDHVRDLSPGNSICRVAANIKFPGQNPRNVVFPEYSFGLDFSLLRFFVSRQRNEVGYGAKPRE